MHDVTYLLRVELLILMTGLAPSVKPPATDSNKPATGAEEVKEEDKPVTADIAATKLETVTTAVNHRCVLLFSSYCVVSKWFLNTRFVTTVWSLACCLTTVILWRELCCISSMSRLSSPFSTTSVLSLTQQKLAQH